MKSVDGPPDGQPAIDLDCVVFGKAGVDLMVQPVPHDKTLAEPHPHLDVDRIRASTAVADFDMALELSRRS